MPGLSNRARRGSGAGKIYGEASFASYKPFMRWSWRSASSMSKAVTSR